MGGAPSPVVLLTCTLAACGLGAGDPADDDAAPSDDDSAAPDGGPGVDLPFETIASGDLPPDGDSVHGECADAIAAGADDCCTWLTVELIESSEDLLERMSATVRSNTEIPAVDFDGHFALFSYTARCDLSIELAVDAVRLDGTTLLVEETLHVPPSTPAESGRPWNVVRIPSGAYEVVVGTLTVVHSSD